VQVPKILLTGKIIIDNINKSFKNASIHIYLEDVSLLDREAQIIAEKTIQFVSCEKGIKKQLQFVIHQEKIKIDQRSNYSIRVHIDLKNNKLINKGDYLTVRNYPVLTFGFPNNITVHIREVK